MMALTEKQILEMRKQALDQTAGLQVQLQAAVSRLKALTEELDEQTKADEEPSSE